MSTHGLVLRVPGGNRHSRLSIAAKYLRISETAIATTATDLPLSRLTLPRLTLSAIPVCLQLYQAFCLHPAPHPLHTSPCLRAHQPSCTPPPSQPPAPALRPPARPLPCPHPLPGCPTNLFRISLWYPHINFHSRPPPPPTPCHHTSLLRILAAFASHTMPFFLRHPLLTIPRLCLLPPLRAAPPPMLPLGESGLRLGVFQCGLRVWVGNRG